MRNGAIWLHKALETYRVPRRLVGKESRDGKIPARLFPIFRDREELPVSADLPSNINEALRESRYLIVICSPRAAQSRWVGEEIKAFKKLGREDRILALISDGEPNASDGKPGFVSEDECFPEPMRYRVDADGQSSSERTEPIAADAREGKDGKNNAKLKLLAGLLGVNYDELKQREQERRIRRARAIGISSLVLVGIFAALAIALFFKEREARAEQAAAERARGEARTQQLAAEHARDEARRTLSHSDFLQALRSINEDKALDALAQLGRSLSYDPGNEAALCRLATLLAYHNYAIPICTLKDVAASSAEFSPDGERIMTVYKDNTVRVWDAQTGQPVTEPMKHQGPVHTARFSTDGKRIVTVCEDGSLPRIVQIWDAQTGQPLTPPVNYNPGVRSARFSPDGQIVIASSRSERIWDAQIGQPLTQLIESDSWDSVEFSSDVKRIVTVSKDKTARVWDAQTSQPLSPPIRHDSNLVSPQFSPDGERILTMLDANTARVWDARTGQPLTRPMQDNSWVGSVQFSPDGMCILTTCVDGTTYASNIACVWMYCVSVNVLFRAAS